MTIAVGADIVVELNGVLIGTRDSLLYSEKRASRPIDRQLIASDSDKQLDVEGRQAEFLTVPKT